jgi:hypothetical protein
MAHAFANPERRRAMFVGHYAAALVLRPLKASPSLPVLFAGAQLMDIAFFSLVLSGTESLRLTPGITAMNPLDLYNMPFSHGLAGTLIQSAAFGLLVAALMGEGLRLAGGLIAAMAVFSHWVLDVVTHRPDMPLFTLSDKIGAGLWNHPAAAMTVETVVIAAAFALYAALSTPKAGGRVALLAMAAALILLQCVNWFGPEPNPLTTPLEFIAAQGLAAYAILTGFALWLERTRAV